MWRYCCNFFTEKDLNLNPSEENLEQKDYYAILYAIITRCNYFENEPAVFSK